MIFIMQMEGDLKMFNKNDIKKELLKSKVMSKFSHYSTGKLYYTVQLEAGLFVFPISTIEKNTKNYTFEGPVGPIDVNIDNVISLSSDLGTTNFDAEIKASFLNRWIDKAIDSEEFIKIG